MKREWQCVILLTFKSTLSRSSCYSEIHVASVSICNFFETSKCKIIVRFLPKRLLLKIAVFSLCVWRECVPTDVWNMSLSKEVCKEQKIRPVCAHTPTGLIFHTVSYRHTHTHTDMVDYWYVPLNRHRATVAQNHGGHQHSPDHKHWPAVFLSHTHTSAQPNTFFVIWLK